MRVVWSEPAVADVSAIHDYIAGDSPRIDRTPLAPCGIITSIRARGP